MAREMKVNKVFERRNFWGFVFMESYGINKQYNKDAKILSLCLSLSVLKSSLFSRPSV